MKAIGVSEASTRPDLTEARAIVEALAAIAADLHPADKLFVGSWQHYLRRTGEAAAIGRWRLHRLRLVSEAYDIRLPELVAIDISDLRPGLDI